MCVYTHTFFCRFTMACLIPTAEVNQLVILQIYYAYGFSVTSMTQTIMCYMICQNSIFHIPINHKSGIMSSFILIEMFQCAKNLLKRKLNINKFSFGVLILSKFWVSLHFTLSSYIISHFWKKLMKR